jgi:hypothetical protein
MVANNEKRSNAPNSTSINGKMHVSNVIKLWIAISLVSLIVWATTLLIPDYQHFFNVVEGRPDFYVKFTWSIFWAGLVGQNCLFVGAIVGLLGLLIVWFWRKDFARIKVLVASALALVGIYYVCLSPSVPFLIRSLNFNSRTFGSYFLGLTYVVQIVFVVPTILALSYKVARYKGPADKVALLKWASVAFAAFVVALWANIALRWLDMLFTSGVGTFLSVGDGIRVFGFLDGIVCMSLALVFGVLCSYRSMKQQFNSAVTWMGLSMVLMGFQYATFLIYAYEVNFLSVALLLDWWTIPLLGLGATILIMQAGARRSRNDEK